jgi:uncharacterized protein (DUF885 family)
MLRLSCGLCAALFALVITPFAEATPATAAQANLAASAESVEQRFDRTVHQFLESLWLVDPEAALWAGRYEGAARLPVRNGVWRDRYLAFIARWQTHFAGFDAAQLNVARRTDLAMIRHRLESDHWYLTTYREFEWNPSDYNVAGPIDQILNTDYAPLVQRLRALTARLAAVPAYYKAAQANIRRPTREHTQLALMQAPGTLAVLDSVAAAGKASHLKPKEKQQLAARIQGARKAVSDWQAWLKRTDAALAKSGEARSFRIGAELYEAKFARDIQSGSTARATYDKALAAREELLERMDKLSHALWPKVMGHNAPTDDRFARIGAVIDKLSANHVAAKDFYAEIRRQIPLLHEWVVQKDLVTMDPDKPLVVRETPLYQRGVAGAGIDAPGPYRPQDRTYYNVTPFDDIPAAEAESTLREYNHWILQILNIHEAIPGHYTQLVHANKSPSLVKTLFGNGAMIEGWAVYSERVMLDSGWGDHTPEMWLMYSKWLLRSVTNTLLDYRVHVLGLEEKEALDLLMRQAFQTEREAREKWRRVQLTSVQLTSYFSGYSAIMELRAAQQTVLGERFNLKAFHDEFLSYGSAPVATIAALMQEKQALKSSASH